MSTYLCALGCDKECISYCGSWSKDLKAADLLKSYQTPDTVLNTVHVFFFCPLRHFICTYYIPRKRIQGFSLLYVFVLLLYGP